jgi:hypothetical protein
MACQIMNRGDIQLAMGRRHTGACGFTAINWDGSIGLVRIGLGAVYIDPCLCGDPTDGSHCAVDELLL